MALKSLNLDDRRFKDLLEAAMARAQQSCPDWNDWSAGDPGRVMVELFAYLTEVMLYRLNRIPEKVYIELLRLIGIKLKAPAAATVTLRFSVPEPLEREVEIPRGTRVSGEAGEGTSEPPVFVTAETVTIAAGASAAEARAYHCVWIEGEHLGNGTGFPGQTVRVAHAPIVAPTGDQLDLVLGVEATEDELDPNMPVRRHGDQTYRIWQECEEFADLGDQRHVYVVDRASGMITFAPALRIGPDGEQAEATQPLAEAPARGRRIRAWYRTGGGVGGNVNADTLTTLKDSVAGVALEVTNPAPATGGRAAESLDHALLRGPQELHSLRRAVTAQDFEMLALRSSGGIDRAYAYTKHNLWKYAPRGTVEIVCTPHVPAERYGSRGVTAELLREYRNDAVLDQVRQELDRRRPLGTQCLVRWGRCKTVQVRARLLVYREEDQDAVRRRVIERLNAMISPLSRDGTTPGWRHGQPLSALDVYRIVSAEPGVKYADDVRLRLTDAPTADVSALTVDAFQAHTWYAASGDGVYRSTNDGRGWELVAHIDGGVLKLLQSYPAEAAGPNNRAGLLAAIAEFEGGKSRVYASRDSGESWEEIGARPQFLIDGMAWMDRDGTPVLLLASERGLYELALRPGAEPTAVLVDPDQQNLGFWAVAVSTDVWGQTCVAVAARSRDGVYLSRDGGKPGTFSNIGMTGQEVRKLAVQHRGPQRYLWAGMEAIGEDKGSGCARWQLPDSPEGWQSFGAGWNAGGCLAIAPLGGQLLAGTRRHGVLRLNSEARNPSWSQPDVECGLPMQQLKRMHPVDFVAATPESLAGAQPRILAAGPRGIYRSDSAGKFELCSKNEFENKVTLPPTWLFCSGEHEIEVSYDEGQRD